MFEIDLYDIKSKPIYSSKLLIFALEVCGFVFVVPLQSLDSEDLKEKGYNI